MVFLAKKEMKFTLSLVAILLLLTGCANNTTQQARQAVPVKAMKVVQKDVGLVSEYAGQIQGTNEVPIQARVAGHVVEKMIVGGQEVKAGQPLFRIDSRQYVSAVLSAQAQLAQAEAVLANTSTDTRRYRELYKANAIAEQMLATQETMEKQQEALVRANRAVAQKAQDDLNDTLVVSPISGRLYVNDVSVGAFVQPGSTVLVTVGVTDPIYAQFSMSENEYLKLRKTNSENFVNNWGSNVSITLSDGTVHPFTGKVTEIDRGLGANSGTLAIKASFANPDGILMPGMFARVKISGISIKDAVLIPQRAIQQVLEKAYVMVINAENKVEAKQVMLGSKVGSFYVVEKGVAVDETIVVEGLTKVQEGVAVQATILTAQDFGFTFE